MPCFFKFRVAYHESIDHFDTSASRIFCMNHLVNTKLLINCNSTPAYILELHSDCAAMVAICTPVSGSSAFWVAVDFFPGQRSFSCVFLLGSFPQDSDLLRTQAILITLRV